MGESQSHRRAKAAGAFGQTEKHLADNRRLDAATPGRATEVERSGAPDRLREAAPRLRDSGKPQKVLQVRQKEMPAAVEAMKEIGVRGTVKNKGGTERRSVK